MIDYKQAKDIALALKPSSNKCVEFTDAYMFICSLDSDSDGGVGACVVLKETGKAISDTAYYTSKMVSGEKTARLREFEV